MDLQKLMPDSILGWNMQTIKPLLTKNDLYDYINGGAELYISYGFGEALSCAYIKEGQPEVIVDVYDLIESRNAFGIFSQTREKENLDLGQGAFNMPGAVIFWKDHYYISISTWESTIETESVILALGKYINERINSTGDKPALIGLLPEENLIPFAYLYFHHNIWLNSYFFISNENLLNIDNRTDALLAKYSFVNGKKFLLFIQYPDKEIANQSFSSFGRVFFPYGLKNNCAELADETWMAAAIMNKIIVAVFKGSSCDDANQLLRKATDKINHLQNQ